MNEKLRTTVNMGLILGAIALSLSMIGVIDAFNQRFIITDYLTLGQLLLFGTALVAGFLVVNQLKDVTTLTKLLHGGLAGILTGVPIFGLLLVTLVWETIRNSFINVKPDLIAILTLNNENVVVGGILLMLTFGVLGIVGFGLAMLPSQWRRPFSTSLGWAIGAGALSDIVKGVLRPRLSSDALGNLFGSSSGLQLVPFLALVVVLTAVFFWWQQGGQTRVQAIGTNLTPAQRKNSRRISISLLVIFLLVLPSLLGIYLSEIFNEVGRFILMGLGLNIAIGLAGLLDLGYVTNFAVGAYIMALLTSSSEFGLSEPISFWLAVPICIVAAMITGFVLALPVLKMRGDYLAIATLGFGEIIRVLARSDALKAFIGGAQGILQVPQAKISGFLAQGLGYVLDPINNFLEPFELGILATKDGEIIFGNPPQIYYLFILASLLMLFVSHRLNNSRTGRRWMAIREDEDVAAAMGINTTNAKVLAFTLSAASGGLAGAIFAAKLGSIFPTSFELLISINVLSLIIVGGLGSIPGIIVGAFALVGIPQLLSEFAEFRLLLYGVALIVMMLVRPEGLWPSEVHRREIQSEETAVPITPTPEANTL